MSDLVSEKNIMGTQDNNLGAALLQQAYKASTPKNQESPEITAAFFTETAPRNPLEAMIISQMAAAHAHAMEMFAGAKNSTIHEVEIARLKMAEKLMRTFANSLDVLERSRRKVHQSVKVEHVHVNAGGQAIVGCVSQGGVKNE
ncbi:hypothetical protein [Desulfonatronovibrio magnus]|uniref:hypothetical protein n=1 Tax=Desulfonatronovibrio magnus TaxID=698827 RepID=UPI00069799F2|nr:hypothetical protein [Desulfonatronovibrio magnus]